MKDYTHNGKHCSGLINPHFTCSFKKECLKHERFKKLQQSNPRFGIVITFECPMLCQSTNYTLIERATK